jgi:hypothetical protein
MEFPERLKCLLVCEWFAWPGDTDHLDIVIFFDHFFYQSNGFVRVQHPRCNPRAAFIDTIEVPDTVVALDITLGCHRYMTTSKSVTGLLGKTWVFLNLTKLFRVPLDLLSLHYRFPVTFFSHDKQ